MNVEIRGILNFIIPKNSYNYKILFQGENKTLLSSNIVVENFNELILYLKELKTIFNIGDIESENDIAIEIVKKIKIEKQLFEDFIERVILFKELIKLHIIKDSYDYCGDKTGNYWVKLMISSQEKELWKTLEKKELLKRYEELFNND